MTRPVRVWVQNSNSAHPRQPGLRIARLPVVHRARSVHFGISAIRWL